MKSYTVVLLVATFASIAFVAQGRHMRDLTADWSGGEVHIDPSLPDWNARGHTFRLEMKDGRVFDNEKDDFLKSKMEDNAMDLLISHRYSSILQNEEHAERAARSAHRFRRWLAAQEAGDYDVSLGTNAFGLPRGQSKKNNKEVESQKNFFHASAYELKIGFPLGIPSLTGKVSVSGSKKWDYTDEKMELEMSGVLGFEVDLGVLKATVFFKGTFKLEGQYKKALNLLREYLLWLWNKNGDNIEKLIKQSVTNAFHKIKTSKVEDVAKKLKALGPAMAQHFSTTYYDDFKQNDFDKLLASFSKTQQGVFGKLVELSTQAFAPLSQVTRDAFKEFGLQPDHFDDTTNWESKCDAEIAKTMWKVDNQAKADHATAVSTLLAPIKDELTTRVEKSSSLLRSLLASEFPLSAKVTYKSKVDDLKKSYKVVVTKNDDLTRTDSWTDKEKDKPKALSVTTPDQLTLKVKISTDSLTSSFLVEEEDCYVTFSEEEIQKVVTGQASGDAATKTGNEQGCQGKLNITLVRTTVPNKADLEKSQLVLDLGYQFHRIFNALYTFHGMVCPKSVPNHIRKKSNCVDTATLTTDGSQECSKADEVFALDATACSGQDTAFDDRFKKAIAGIIEPVENALEEIAKADPIRWERGRFADKNKSSKVKVDTSKVALDTRVIKYTYTATMGIGASVTLPGALDDAEVSVEITLSHARDGSFMTMSAMPSARDAYDAKILKEKPPHPKWLSLDGKTFTGSATLPIKLPAATVGRTGDQNFGEATLGLKCPLGKCTSAGELSIEFSLPIGSCAFGEMDANDGLDPSAVFTGDGSSGARVAWDALVRLIDGLGDMTSAMSRAGSTTGKADEADKSKKEAESSLVKAVTILGGALETALQSFSQKKEISPDTKDTLGLKSDLVATLSFTYSLESKTVSREMSLMVSTEFGWKLPLSSFSLEVSGKQGFGVAIQPGEEPPTPGSGSSSSSDSSSSSGASGASSSSTTSSTSAKNTNGKSPTSSKTSTSSKSSSGSKNPSKPSNKANAKKELALALASVDGHAQSAQVKDDLAALRRDLREIEK